jgi:hypothetical protein
MEEADGGRNGAGSRTRLRWTRIPRSLISSSRTCGTICHPERRPAAVTAEPFAGWILCAAACAAHPSTLMKGHRGGTQRIALPRGSLESNQVDGNEVVCLAGEGPMQLRGRHHRPPHGSPPAGSVYPLTRAVYPPRRWYGWHPHPAERAFCLVRSESRVAEGNRDCRLCRDREAWPGQPPNIPAQECNRYR